MERDYNNSVRCDSPSLKDSENDQSLVGKVKSIITPISKWFRKQDDDSQITRKREEDDLEDDMLQMQPPSKRVKLPNDLLGNNCNNTTSNKLPSNDISSIRNFTNFPEPVAGPSGIKCRKTLNTHTSYTTETLNGHKDSDSEDSTSGYSSVARIGSREQVCQSLESSKQPSPTQHTTSNNRTLFPPSNTAVNRSLFTDRTMSPHMNTSLSSRRPSFNASTFGSPNFVDKTLSTKKIINSPFYSGRTVYGGASAYGRKLGRTELDLKTNLKNSIHIKPVNQQRDESNNLVLGKTARRILETLEQYSSPISDAKKIPMASKKAKEGLISKYVGANPYLVRETKGALHKELQVPSVTDLLKMKQKTRLQDSTEAVRQIAKSSKSDLNSESYKLAANEEEKEKHTGKMRTKISSVRPKASSHDDMPVSEVSLKPVSLPITTLPKFDIVVPPPKPVVASKPPDKPAPGVVTTPPAAPTVVPKPQQTEHKQNKSTDRSAVEYKFSDPLVIAENLKSIIAMNNFKFSKPLSKQIQDEVAASKVSVNFKMPENKLPLLVPNKTKNNGDALVKTTPVLKSGSVMDILGKKSESIAEKFKPAKDSWECNTCLIRNAADKTKCAACETPRTKKPVENKPEFGSQFKMTQDKWECTACLVRNSNIDTKCVSCTTPKPTGSASTSIPAASSFGDKFKPKEAGTWGCMVCMIQNKLELGKCSACSAPNSKHAISAQSFGDKFKPATNTWECSSCMVRNKEESNKCIACESPRNAISAQGFGDKFKPATNTWECSSCMVRNKEESNKCIACESPRNGTVRTAEGSWFKTPKEDEWECSVCMVKNKKALSKCQCCETVQPGSLKTSEDKPIAKFNFGIDKATAASFSFGVPPGAQQELPKLAVPPASVFGEAAKSTASSGAVPTFSFGVPNSTERKRRLSRRRRKRLP
ncbi:unnamed protein product [Callosobruchus maculatus]|uniref:Nuclear pore complex protein Nup153 n=1 Tax=Callosobruchus maculatus TaxID=64391 RepID=A0A653CIT9_CALMS|nr:unnamed protein product [Callosobruchus maculatus]